MGTTLVRCPCGGLASRTARPRSSADRAPASGAGGAGSSPAGGAAGNSSSLAVSRHRVRPQLRLAIHVAIPTHPMDILSVKDRPCPDTCRSGRIRPRRLHAFVGRDSNGRKRYASKTFHGTKKEAPIALAAFVTEVARDRTTSVAAEPITVTQTLEKGSTQERLSSPPPRQTYIVWRSASRTRAGADGRRPIATAPHLGAPARLLLDHLVAVISWTGWRRGEVAELQWRDVDLTKGSILSDDRSGGFRWNTSDGNQDR